MALGKRPREIGAKALVDDDEQEDGVVALGGALDEPAQEEQQAKRRRSAGFGLGILSELAGKVYRATASVFGRGGAERCVI